MGRSGKIIVKYFVLFISIFLLFNKLTAVEAAAKIRSACLDNVDSTVTLRWNNPTDICNSFVEHIIYGREDAFSPFIELDRIDNFVAQQSVFKIPNLKLWEFYIATTFACNGIDTFFSSIVAIDKQEPSVWYLDSVSIDLKTQQVLIGWRHHPDDDKEAYLIYYVDVNNIIIANTPGVFHIDSTTGQPDIGPLSYSIAVYDSCKNASPISALHKSIYLTARVDSCTKEVYLNWTSYQGVNVNGYQIFQSTEETTGYGLISNVERNSLDHKTGPLVPGQRYCFYIQMYSSGSPVITSTSNRICIQIPETFDSEIYASRVSVSQNNDSAEFSFVRDDNHEYVELWDISKPALLKRIETDTIGGFYKFSIKHEGLNSSIFDFQFIAKGDCGIAFDSSLITNNILLEVTETNTEAQLIWSFYNNWDGGVEKYQVLKYTGDEFPERSTWNILAEEASFVNQHNNFYEEDAFFNTNCFVIRAIESGPNRFGITDTAYSNTVCFIRTLIVYFPSALTPNSLINSFKVVGVGIDYEKSSYQIYNRWGEKIWETKTGLVEWNGVDNTGKQVPDDIYVYKATIIGLLGDIKKYRGTIQVIR